MADSSPLLEGGFKATPSKSPFYALRQRLVRRKGDGEDAPPGVLDRAKDSMSRGGFANSSFVVMNAIMGSGLLALPYACKSAGIVLFLLLMTIMALCADYAIHLLLVCCDRFGVTSYEEVGQKAFGYRGNMAACLAIMLQNLGGMTGDLVIVGDLLPKVMTNCFGVAHGSLIANREFLMCLVTAVLVLPVACLRRIGFIGYSSTIAIALMVCFAVAVIVQSFEFTCADTKASGQTSGAHADSSLTCQYDYFHVGMDTFFVLPTIAFSFVCHTTVLPAYAELRKRSKAKMQRVSHTAIGICWSVYGLTAVFGYLSFGSGAVGDDGVIVRDDAHGTEANLFDSFSDYDPKSRICVLRFLILLSFALIVPLLNYPARKSAIFILNRGESADTSWGIFYSITFGYIGVVLLLALFIPNIKVVFGLVGSTTSVTLMFLLPGIFYLKLIPGKLTSREKLPAVLHVAFGLLVMFVSLGGIFAKFAGVKVN